MGQLFYLVAIVGLALSLSAAGDEPAKEGKIRSRGEARRKALEEAKRNTKEETARDSIACYSSLSKVAKLLALKDTELVMPANAGTTESPLLIWPGPINDGGTKRNAWVIFSERGIRYSVAQGKDGRATHLKIPQGSGSRFVSLEVPEKSSFPDEGATPKYRTGKGKLLTQYTISASDEESRGKTYRTPSARGIELSLTNDDEAWAGERRTARLSVPTAEEILWSRLWVQLAVVGQHVALGIGTDSALSDRVGDRGSKTAKDAEFKRRRDLLIEILDVDLTVCGDAGWYVDDRLKPYARDLKIPPRQFLQARSSEPELRRHRAMTVRRDHEGEGLTGRRGRPEEASPRL